MQAAVLLFLVVGATKAVLWSPWKKGDKPMCTANTLSECQRPVQAYLGQLEMPDIITLTIPERDRFQNVCRTFWIFDECYVTQRAYCEKRLLKRYEPVEKAFRKMCNDWYEVIGKNLACFNQTQFRRDEQKCWDLHFSVLSKPASLSLQVEHECRTYEKYLYCHLITISEHCSLLMAQAFYDILNDLHSPNYEGVCDIFHRIRPYLQLPYDNNRDNLAVRLGQKPKPRNLTYSAQLPAGRRTLANVASLPTSRIDFGVLLVQFIIMASCTVP